MDGLSAKRPRPLAPERRIDPIKGFDVILAPQRLERPGAIQLHPWADGDEAPCPFCRGQEHEVPQAVIAFPGDNNWRVKIVPNKYPALSASSGLDAPIESVHSCEPAHGKHEVVIESADHVRSLTELSVSGVAESLKVVQQRFRELAQDGQIVSVIFFKNCGPAAGASLAHVHSQILGLPYTPTRLQTEYAAAERYYRQTSRCFLCDRIRELEVSGRHIRDSRDFRVFCPAVSRFPYEACIVPRQHASHFESASAAEITDFASVLHAHLTRLEQALPHVCYNLALHSSRFDTRPNDHYHWHFEVIPRIAMLAGFELATGQFLNLVDPVDAAKCLQPER